MEIIDIVDRDDRIIGKSEREIPHGRPDMIHRAVHLFVVDGRGRLLLQKRGAGKEVEPGKWDTSVGGHLHAGETYRDAAERETFEELKIRTDDMIFLYSYLYRNQFESEYITSFMIRYDDLPDFQEEEISEVRFFSVPEIEYLIAQNMATPNFIFEYREYFRKILDETITKS